MAESKKMWKANEFITAITGEEGIFNCPKCGKGLKYKMTHWPDTLTLASAFDDVPDKTPSDIRPDAWSTHSVMTHPPRLQIPMEKPGGVTRPSPSPEPNQSMEPQLSKAGSSTAEIRDEITNIREGLLLDDIFCVPPKVAIDHAVMCLWKLEKILRTNVGEK